MLVILNIKSNESTVLEFNPALIRPLGFQKIIYLVKPTLMIGLRNCVGRWQFNCISLTKFLLCDSHFVRWLLSKNKIKKRHFGNVWFGADKAYFFSSNMSRQWVGESVWRWSTEWQFLLILMEKCCCTIEIIED